MSTTARVLSLIPSATDWVTALGLADRLVGVTHECDAPEGVPVVVEPLVAHDPGDPVGVDTAVAAAAEEGRALYRVDEALVAELGPTVIITQQLCEVCAVPASQVARLRDRLGDVRIVSLDGVTLDGVLDDVRRLGEALGAGGPAAGLAADLRARLTRVGAAVANRDRPGVAVLEWPDPPWVAGHWVPDQIRAAGGVPTVGVPGRPSERADWDAFSGADVCVVAPCGYDLAEAVRAAEASIGLLPSVAEVWAVDAQRCYSRPGAGLVDGVKALAGILHPDAAPAPRRDVARRVAAAEPTGRSA